MTTGHSDPDPPGAQTPLSCPSVGARQGGAPRDQAESPRAWKRYRSAQLTLAAASRIRQRSALSGRGRGTAASPAHHAHAGGGPSGPGRPPCTWRPGRAHVPPRTCGTWGGCVRTAGTVDPAAPPPRRAGPGPVPRQPCPRRDHDQVTTTGPSRGHSSVPAPGPPRGEHP